MIDLKRFCKTDGTKIYLSAPFHENGNTYASNGHIAIEIEGIADPAIAKAPALMKGKIPSYLQEARANNIELALQLPPPDKTCEYCNGSGRIIVHDCDECDGNGSFEHGSYEYNCKKCNGIGAIYTTPSLPDNPDEKVCAECAGFGAIDNGKFFYTQAHQVTYCFQERYLRLISELPSVRFYVSEDNSKPARFDFDAGRGVLMPCRV